LKRALSIVILLSLIVSQLTKLVVVINFEFNKATIAKTKCVKRFEKKNTCQGKCHLKKQLKKAEEAESQGASLLKAESEGVVACASSELLIASNTINYSIRFNSQQLLIINKFNSLLDRPPASA